jgi:hypothetical protein
MKNPSIKRWERRKVQDHKGETSQEEMIIENCCSSTRYLYLILQNPQKEKKKKIAKKRKKYSEAKDNKISCRSFVPTHGVGKKHHNRGAQFIENGETPREKNTVRRKKGRKEKK